MENLFEKIGGRKFVLTVLILLLGLAVELLGKNGLSQNFVALLLGASTVFGVANAAVTMKAGMTTAAATEGASTGDEANVKADQLASSFESHTLDTIHHLTQQDNQIEQMRAELATQAESLALATKLIKASMKINV